MDNLLFNNVYRPNSFFSMIIKEMKIVYSLLAKMTDDRKYIISRYELDAVKNIVTHDLGDASEDEIRYRLNVAIEKIDLKKPRDLPMVTYKIIFNKHFNKLGHYFRHLYHILKFVYDNEKKEESLILDKHKIEESDYTGYYYYIKEHQFNFNSLKLDKEKICIKNKLEIKIQEKLKKNYAKFYDYASKVQAQMSEHELVVLFYNALVYKKMEDLIYHYFFIRNIFIEDLIDESHKGLYYQQFLLGEQHANIPFLDFNKNIYNKKNNI